MEFFGISLDTIYLIALFVSGAGILLYILFGDVLEGVGEVLNPVLILSFITIGSAAGYIFEVYSPINSVLILIFSCVIAFILTAGLNYFILIPLSSAEESLVYTEQSLKGRIGKVITPIPEAGYGEVLIESASGRIAKPAMGYNKEAIGEGANVLIVLVKQGVLYVTLYDDIYKEGF